MSQDNKLFDLERSYKQQITYRKESELLALEKWFNTLPNVKPVKIGHVKIGKQVYPALQYVETERQDIRIYIVTENAHVPKYWHNRRFIAAGKEFYLAGYYPATLFLSGKWAEYWSSDNERERVKSYHPFGSNMILIENTCLESDKKTINVNWIDL